MRVKFEFVYGKKAIFVFLRDNVLYMPNHNRYHILGRRKYHLVSAVSSFYVKVTKLEKKLRGLSPRANYTDKAAAAGRRS